MTTTSIGWPRTLFGRVALVVASGLALSHALTYSIVQRERSEQGHTMMGAYLARDVAAAVAVLDRVPAAERPDWLARLERPHYRYELQPVPPGPGVRDARLASLATGVRAALGPAAAGDPVQLTDDTAVLPLRLADGAPANVQLRRPSGAVSAATLALLAAQLGLLAIAGWWAVRMAVRPLQRLADAADSVAPGQPMPPLPQGGPEEVARAARALADMGQRIATHGSERLGLLAAISHDLQTPITRMRLRLEELPPGSVRDRLEADLAQMLALVQQGLAYARSAHAVLEAPRAVDLASLVDTLAWDARDAGQAVTWRGHVDAPVVTRVQSLQRLLTNLVDNAVKFGGAAEILIAQKSDTVLVIVRDEGPGIPVGELARVFNPFYRVEGSRNRETGGTGLGLAIARQLAEALQAQLTLANRPEGGLEACLVLRAQASTSE